MRILAIGDLHGKLPKEIPKKNIDLIVLTGDLGKANLMREIAFAKKRNENFEPSREQIKKSIMQAYNSSINVLKKLKKISHILMVYGNVELDRRERNKIKKEIKLKLPCLDNFIKKENKIINANKGIISIKGKKIAGYSYFIESGWVKRFKRRNKEGLKECFEKNKNAKSFFRKLTKVDLLVTHQPPYKILDKVGKNAPKDWRGKHAGSEIILSYIKRKKPDYVICGHIHESHGEKTIGKTKVINLGERRFKILNL